MKDNWHSCTLNELCILVSGRHLKPNEYNGSKCGLGYLTGPADFGELHPVVSRWTEHPRAIALCGDILITVKGAGVGKLNVLDADRVAISRQLMAIRVKDEVPRFVYEFLRWKFEHFQSIGNGATVPGLSRDDILSLRLGLPSRTEQRRIVNILDEAFAGIATAKANAEKNLRNARELFESELDAVFSRRGDGWVETTLGDCFKVRSGDFLPAKAMVKSGPVDVYGGNGIVGKHDKKNLSGEHIVIGRVGAKCGNVRHIRGDFWLTDNAFYISEYFHQFDRAFLVRLLERKDLRSTANQAAQPVISFATIKDVILVFPIAESTQVELSRKLDKLETETTRLEALYRRKLAALDELKKSLLHRAFSGEL